MKIKMKFDNEIKYNKLIPISIYIFLETLCGTCDKTEQI